MLRFAVHLATWVVFVYSTARALVFGWRPTSDNAEIALRAWDALSVHGPLVGQATRLARGVYDPGPVEYWLLALPVHLDPAHGVMWGAALWCMIAASITIEAAWAVAGYFGGLVAALGILATLLWIPAITHLPSWNPWFGMMFFLAALAAGVAVISGHRGWWPVLMVAASVAAQAHLMFAIVSGGLVLVAFIAGLVDSHLERTGYRWAVAGLLAGVACWIGPLIQQFSVRQGNLTALLAHHGAGRPSGLGFGLRALAASVQPPPAWWVPLSSLRFSLVSHRSSALGAAALVLLLVILAVAVYPLRSRRVAAIAFVAVLTSVTAVVTYASVPAQSIAMLPTPYDNLDYLMAPMLPTGVLAWLAAGSILVLIGRHAMRHPGPAPAPRAERRGTPAAVPRTGAMRWWALIGGLAAMAVMVSITMVGITQWRPSTALGRAVGVASHAIERKLPPQPVEVVLRGSTVNVRRRVTLGLAYALKAAGYRPEILYWASELGPAYELRRGPTPKVRVRMQNSDVSKVSVIRQRS